jgi:hypothetical protein
MMRNDFNFSFDFFDSHKDSLYEFAEIMIDSGSKDPFKLDLFSEDVSLNIPGGLSETPKSKPYDFSRIIIPDGDSERPKGAPYDVNISIPGKKEISLDTYNSALTSIKKSFKEGVELLKMLENVKTTESSFDFMNVAI